MLIVTYALQLLGWSALVGFAFLVALLPVQYYFSKLFVDVQKKLLVATDARLNLVTEVLGAIRLVKVRLFFYLPVWTSTCRARG